MVFNRRLARLTPKSCSQVDAVMREWLDSRRAGHVNMPKPDEPTSVLRPTRAITFREKYHKKKKRLQQPPKKAEQKTYFQSTAAPAVAVVLRADADEVPWADEGCTLILRCHLLYIQRVSI